MRLAAERGIDSTTTRAIAEEAGVSELTIFRHFGDKATLVREAIHETAPIDRLRQYEPAIDASSPGSVVQGLAACLRFLRDEMLQHEHLLRFAMSEARRHPELRDDLMAAPVQAGALLQRALQQAAPQLRPEVDLRAAVISMEGVVLLTVLWSTNEWMRLERQDWDALFEAAVRPLVTTAPLP
jgi:AcrR family transcriptional regulator